VQPAMQRAAWIDRSSRRPGEGIDHALVPGTPVDCLDSLRPLACEYGDPPVVSTQEVDPEPHVVAGGVASVMPRSARSMVAPSLGDRT